MKTWLNRCIKFLASLKLAVLVISAIATVIAVGTFVEAKYDATAAKKIVYESVWMYGVMGVLAINLIAVMVDRWPWKPRHASFVLAHIGILILMFGAILTQKYGLDGTMRVDIGQSSQLVVVPETDILVYSSFDGDRFTKLVEQEVDFFKKPPTAEKPFVVSAFNSEIKFVDYKPYVIPSRKVVAAQDSRGRRGAGLRFQVQNPNVNVVEWIVQRRPNEVATHNFGPAAVHLGPAPEKGRGENEIFFTPQGETQIKYVVFQKDSDKPAKSGILKEGDVFNPGWRMPLEVRVLRYLPQAEDLYDLVDRETPTPLTMAAVKMIFNNKEYWMVINDTVKVFTEDAVYVISYVNRRIDLKFPIKLLKFDMVHYPGTVQAAEYKSKVEVPNLGEHEISMNEPLKYNGFTFYQASFQEDPNTRQPIASIFSVNQDPGRWIKYLGSFIMSLGIILLFYFKQKAKKGTSV